MTLTSLMPGPVETNFFERADLWTPRSARARRTTRRRGAAGLRGAHEGRAQGRGGVAVEQGDGGGGRACCPTASRRWRTGRWPSPRTPSRAAARRAAAARPRGWSGTPGRRARAGRAAPPPPPRPSRRAAARRRPARRTSRRRRRARWASTTSLRPAGVAVGAPATRPRPARARTRRCTTSSPRSRACASVSPTEATCGSLNTTCGTARWSAVALNRRPRRVRVGRRVAGAPAPRWPRRRPGPGTCPGGSAARGR